MKIELNKYEYLMLGIITGMLSTTIAIHANVYVKSCSDFHNCTNVYLFCGLTSLIIFILYLSLKRIYIIKIEKRELKGD